ncbi:hypothetical protein Tco_1480053 [Tanacetum coccineum]
MAFSDSELNQIEFTAATYKRGLATVEEQLFTYRKNKVLFSEEVVVLKREVACKDYEISMLKTEFEKVKQVRVNYNYTTNKTHPNAQRNMVSRAILMKTVLKPFNIAHPKSIVFSAKPMSHFSKSAQSTVRRPYQSKTILTNKRFTQKNNTAKAKAVNTARLKAVNTARPHSAVVNAVTVNQENAIKASAYWVWRPTKLDSASITMKKHNYIDA